MKTLLIGLITLGSLTSYAFEANVTRYSCDSKDILLSGVLDEWTVNYEIDIDEASEQAQLFSLSFTGQGIERSLLKKLKSIAHASGQRSVQYISADYSFSRNDSLMGPSAAIVIRRYKQEPVVLLCSEVVNR